MVLCSRCCSCSLYIALCAALTLSASCAGPQTFIEHNAFLEEKVYPHPELQAQYLNTEDFILHYRGRGQPLDAIVVWIHGTPGEWSDIGRLLLDEGLLSRVLLLSVDRPGWGESQYSDTARREQEKSNIASFSEQSRLLAPLLKKIKSRYPDKPVLLAGHSWGGSLAPHLAMDFPQSIDGLLLLAAGLAPELNAPRWYNKLVNNRFFGWLAGESLRHSNREMYELRSWLTELSERWNELEEMTVLVVQGSDDWLVDPANARYAGAMFEKTGNKTYRIVEISDQGHLLQLERTEKIAQCLIALAEQDLEKC